MDFFVMPQPLHRVSPKATFQHNPQALENKPNLAKHVTTIFAHWGLIEYRLSLLLVRVLGADAAPALAMFSTLTAQHLRLGALEAAAKAALTVQEFKVFKTALDICDAVQTPRNRLAHWIWGDCPELFDALLLAEPKSARERDREFTLELERSDGDSLDLARISALNTWDPQTITVYREGDLARASRDLWEASDIVFLTVAYLDGLFKGRRKFPEARAAITREQLFHHLYERRLFREAWDRSKKD